MPDYSAMPLGVDLSRYQRRPDFGKLAADGVVFCYIKATEGMAVDPDWEWNRAAAAQAGMPFMAYPFLRPSDTPAVIAHFLSVTEGAVPVLDWEVAGVSAAMVESWMAQCEDKLGRVGMAYYGAFPPARPTNRIGTWPRILPQYPARLDAALRLPPCDGAGDLSEVDWRGQWLINQYSGHGHLAGIPGEIDINRMACPVEVLRHWIDTGELKPWASLVRADGPIPKTVAAARLGSRILRLHCIGLDVRELQSRLGIAVDGHYGPQTFAAVELFQRAHRLTVDGIVGPVTATAVLAA